MLADKALHEKDGGQPLIGGLNVVVDRNHFGTQLKVSVPDSFARHYHVTPACDEC